VPPRRGGPMLQSEVQWMIAELVTDEGWERGRGRVVGQSLNIKHINLQENTLCGTATS
jgi:hypothetical protein